MRLFTLKCELESISDPFQSVSSWAVVTLEESDQRLKEGYIFPKPYLASTVGFSMCSSNILVRSSTIIAPPWTYLGVCLFYWEGLDSYLSLYLWYPDLSLP